MDFKPRAFRASDAVSGGLASITGHTATFIIMTILFAVVYMGIYFVLAMIQQAIIFGLVAAGGGLSKPSAPSLVLVQFAGLGFGVLLTFIMSVVFGCLACGYYRALANATDELGVSVGDLFSGFSRFKPCAVIAAISTAIQFALMLIGIAVVGAGFGMGGFGMTHAGSAGFGAIGGGFFVVVIAFVAVFLVWTAVQFFIYPLIEDRELSGLEAFTTGIRAGWANVGGLVSLILFYIVGCAVVAFVFFLMVSAFPWQAAIPLMFIIGGVFGIGVAITGFSAIFYAYREVFGSPDEPTFNDAPPTPQNYGFMDSEE